MEFNYFTRYQEGRRANGTLYVLQSMKKRIHVNMHKIRFNKKHGTNDPVITVKTSHSNRYAHNVDILGPSTVIYRPDKPLSCGARVWIETESEVSLK